MSEQKYHLYLSKSERSFVLQDFVWFQNKLHEQGRYTDTVDLNRQVFKGKAEENQCKMERT